MSRANIELDDRLVKRLKRKAILRLLGSACWQGDLEQSRKSRYTKRKEIGTKDTRRVS